MSRRIFLMTGTIAAAGSASLTLLLSAVSGTMSAGTALGRLIVDNWLLVALMAMFAVGHMVPLWLSVRAFNSKDAKSDRRSGTRKFPESELTALVSLFR